MCLAFGVERLDEVGAKLADVLEMQPPAGLVDKLRGLQAAEVDRRLAAEHRPQGRLPGDRADAATQSTSARCRSRPAGRSTRRPFITLPAVITRDPATGQRNVGMYRMQVLGPRSTAMHWQIHKDGRADFARRATGGWRSRSRSASTRSPPTRASAPLPKHIDELMFAGFLRGEAVELVKGVTVDLEVPAAAEIVLEGYVEQGELTDEGPFGDHTGYYTPAEPFPVFHLTAMTMRRDAIYPSIVVGKPPQEDAWLGKATERIFLPAIRTTLPEIVDYDLPVAGAFHNCAIVSIRKSYPAHAQKVMHAVWGLGLLSLTKAVIVVDAHVDLHDYAQVAFYVGRERRPGPRRRPHRGARRPSRPRDRAPVRRRQARDRRHRQAARRGRPRAGRPRSR